MRAGTIAIRLAALAAVLGLTWLAIRLHGQCEARRVVSYALGLARVAEIPSSASIVELHVPGDESWLCPSASVTFDAEPDVVRRWIQASPSLDDVAPTSESAGIRLYRFHIPKDDCSEGTSVRVSGDWKRVDVNVFFPAAK